MGKAKSFRDTVSLFISSEEGQRFFNFAYSIGAAIVIWGALFKILHLPGGNMLLSIGMGTEVLMFVLTAFDRPPKEYKWENVFPGLTDGENGQPLELQAAPAARNESLPAHTPKADASEEYNDQLTSTASEMQMLREKTAALNKVSDILLESYRAITENSGDVTQASKGYVEQMQDLNRNIAALNTIYEIQLKSVSSQLDSIDRVNRGIKDIRDMYEKSAGESARYCDEIEKMTRYMQQLNSVYEKMITAMTVNMYHPVATPPVQDTAAGAANS